MNVLRAILTAVTTGKAVLFQIDGVKVGRIYTYFGRLGWLGRNRLSLEVPRKINAYNATTSTSCQDKIKWSPLPFTPTRLDLAQPRLKL